MNGEIQDFKQIITRTFNNISAADVEKANSMVSAWKKTLTGIKSNTNPNEGVKLSEHTSVIDLKNGVLLVEADHPGWISLLQMHKGYILRGLSMRVPELKISTLAIKLKGNRGELSDVGAESYSAKKVKNNLKKRIEEEEEQIQGAFPENPAGHKKNAVKTELPPELRAIFENLRKEIKANS